MKSSLSKSNEHSIADQNNKNTTENKKQYPSHIEHNLLLEYQQKCKIALQPITLSSENKNLKFGDNIMLQNIKTKGMLATDIDEKIWYLNNEYVLPATTCTHHTSPVARNVFVLLPVPSTKSTKNLSTEVKIGDDIHYGQEFILATHPKYNTTQYYLQSEIVSHLSSAKFSRQQLVIFHPRISGAIRWRFIYGDHEFRYEFETQVIAKNEKKSEFDGLLVAIKHQSTNSLLAADNTMTLTDFGYESQVSCHVFRPKGRVSTLKKELEGINEDSKGELEQNKWRIIY